MTSLPKWHYDETKTPGVDYADPGVAAGYDHRHQRLRDYQADANAIIDKLGLSAGHRVIDMGAGTGAFTIHAARRCGKIHAVDVSRAMLDVTRAKAAEAGLTNILFCQGGFLTYHHYTELADAMVSIAVLHHLPDFWKLIGLRRAASMLKPGGKLYLQDVVFRFPADHYAAQFDRWVQFFADKAGPDFAGEAASHIRDEYSTCDWIMEGLLERAGFAIDQAEYRDHLNVVYICSKTSERTHLRQTPTNILGRAVGTVLQYRRSSRF